MRWGLVYFFFFKQKTAYEIGTGDWSSDVCSSDLLRTRSRCTRTAPIRYDFSFRVSYSHCLCLFISLTLFSVRILCEIGRASCRERV